MRLSTFSMDMSRSLDFNPFTLCRGLGRNEGLWRERGFTSERVPPESFPELSQQPRWIKIVGPIDGLHRLDKKHGMETNSCDVLSIPWAQRGHTEKNKVSV